MKIIDVFWFEGHSNSYHQNGLFFLCTKSPNIFWSFALTMGFRTISKLAIVLTPLLHPRNFVVWNQSNTIVIFIHNFFFNDFFRSAFFSFFRGLFSWYCWWFDWKFLLISISVKYWYLDMFLLLLGLEITPWSGYLNKPWNFLEVHNQCNHYHLHRLPNYFPWRKSIAKCIAHKSIHQATLASIDILVPIHPEDNICLRWFQQHKEAS